MEWFPEFRKPSIQDRTRSLLWSIQRIWTILLNVCGLLGNRSNYFDIITAVNLKQLYYCAVTAFRNSPALGGGYLF